jgi:PAS domain S-box-containing protein
MARGEQEVETGSAANAARRDATPRARGAPQPRDLARHLAEALEQQAATAEILRIIASSPADVQPAFDAIVASAVRLCHAFVGNVYRFDGELIHFVAQHNFTPEALAITRQLFPARPHRDNATARAILDCAVVHIPDVRRDPEYRSQAWAGALGIRSVLSVPMLRDGRPIGAITVSRAEAGPFSERQITLLQTFADQAVIAVENVRLLNELKARNDDLSETLAQQTATSDILRVISSSPTDIQPVFDTIAQSAARLCEAELCFVYRFTGERLHFVAQHGLTPDGVEAIRRAWPRPPDRGSAAGRSVLNAAVEHIPDVRADPEYQLGAVAEAAAFRSTVAVPMLRDGRPIGVITMSRSQAGPFPERQIGLLKIFAEQAVIAIENSRLFDELEARNRELTEALEQQQATSEILRAISVSPTDMQQVFDMIALHSVRLCNGQFGGVFQFDGRLIHLVAQHGLTPDGVDVYFRMFPRAARRDSAIGRALLGRSIAHIVDVREDPEYGLAPLVEAGAMRCIIAVPMLRDGDPVGGIVAWRSEPEPFSDSQMELLQTFADQAVIALENVRLFQELEARNRELSEALEQQTATGEILRVISRSPTDVQPVFDTIARSARRLCHGESGGVFRFDGQFLQFVACDGLTPETTEAWRQLAPRVALDRGSAAGRSFLSGAVEQIPDVHADPDYEFGAVARAATYRSIVAVPMLREGSPIGAITVNRSQLGLFPDRQIALLQTFADQAVLAIENVRLFQELESRTRDLSCSVGELRALGEVSQAVSSSLDLETVLKTIVTRAVELSGSYSGIIYEFDGTTQTFHARATHRITQEHLEAVRAAPIRLGEGAIGRAGVLREPVEVADTDQTQFVAPQVRGLLDREGLRSLLVVPLIREDRLLGGLVILRRERGAFSPEVVATLRTLAAQSVLAIHNAGLFREVQRQKQYADALVQTSPVAIVTMDLRGTVAGWNPGAERLFGYMQPEALGRPMEDLVATPEVRDEVRTNIRRTLDGEWIRAIARRARKDGTLVDVEISSMPVVVEGAKVGMIGIFHDITELLRARREAEAANEAKSAFLATMSHEIRTPLNAVIGMSGLLLNTALTEDQREYAEVVRQSGDALLTVINDILDFSKIEAGKLELESRPFDLVACVESALDLVAARAAEKGLDLAYQVAEDTPAAIVGDVTRLRQVLLNLLSNAVKFTEAGEVLLSLSAQRADGAAGLHELSFAVRDTGIGIPPERLDRLFHSFSQVDASTSRRYGGTGLGLAISQRLVELMGGRIAVTSQVGAGSEFRFTIRAAAAAAPQTHRDLRGVQPSLRAKRVLVVDDNATNRRILASHLDAWGMSVRATASGGEALAWIRTGEHFDVGILDMHMPEMDGVALAEAIRQQPSGANLPLVLFTSLGRAEARAESQGFAAYLHKPIKPSQLFDTLASVLAERAVYVPQRGMAPSGLDPGMARRHPLRILLAEDNVVNQKVALRLLEQMGYRADVAANGVEAIDAVGRQAYDVVLMDVQMPELDGFEASREISRRWPGARRPRLVAMTANAMEGDRERCMAAGMDDYVAKPIRPEELVAALQRCSRQARSGVRDTPEAGGVADRPAVDREALERLTATMGDAFVEELIATFVGDAGQLVATLRRGLADADLDVFRRAAHSLKSNSETLGAPGLAGMARELEAMARTGRVDGAGDRLEQLAGEYERVARSLEELRRGLPA